MPAANKRYRYQFPSYDALNRMRVADYFAWTGSAWAASAAYDLPSITYDASGNITALTRNRQDGTAIDNLMYTIAGGSNRLSAVADAVTSNPESWDARTGGFSYDANGNQLTAPLPFNITGTTYDPRNLPLSVTVGGTTVTTYRYDEGGQRIAKQRGTGSTEFYVREGATTLGVFTVNAGGTVDSSSFNLLAGDRVVGRRRSAGVVLYYHADLLGSTRAVVQGATVQESYDYDPWGVLMPGRTSGTGSTKDGFTGKEADGESNMTYFGARYYLAAVGRWAQVDPPADSFPAWSPYNYVKGNPVSYIDPLGLNGCKKGDQVCQSLGYQLLTRFGVSDATARKIMGPATLGSRLVGAGTGAMTRGIAGTAAASARAGVVDTRYVGPGEAAVIEQTGTIPNTNARGELKPIYYTTDAPTFSASEAEARYMLPARPSHLCQFFLCKVQNDVPPVGPVAPGASQSVTTLPIPGATRPIPLNP